MSQLTLCISGGLGLQIFTHLLDSQRNVNAVFTDSKSEEIIILAKEKNILTFIGNPREKRGSSFIHNNKISTDIFLSINYLFIIESDMIDLPWTYAINFHGSLLPKYRGRTPHVWAIINGEKETGVTAHIITEGCDEGDIVLQKRIPITKDATGGSILEEFNKTYPVMVDEIIKRIETQTITTTAQDHSQASFYGKRTPKDGKIDWNWNSKRIYAWIQAQAKPYPGAFTFYKKEKITIDKIELLDITTKKDIPNGTILEGGTNPLIKTNDGAVILKKTRENISFKKDITFE